jgi:hypothetical protein
MAPDDGEPCPRCAHVALRAQKEHCLCHLATGDMLREAVAAKTPLGIKARKRGWARLAASGSAAHGSRQRGLHGACPRRSHARRAPRRACAAACGYPCARCASPAAQRSTGGV